MAAKQPVLLSIIELGGYPNFTPLYERLGCQVVMENSMRKALAATKKHQPKVIVAEFNFQSDFRDRTSSLESLLAVVQRLPETQVIVFYEKEYFDQLQRLLANRSVFRTLPFPIDEAELTATLQAALVGAHL